MFDPQRNRSNAGRANNQFPNTGVSRRANTGLRSTRPANRSTVFPDGGTNLVDPRPNSARRQSLPQNLSRSSNGSRTFNNGLNNIDVRQSRSMNDLGGATVNGITGTQQTVEQPPNQDVQYFTTDGSQTLRPVTPATSWLGVYFTPQYAGTGARISRLADGGPAFQAGLRPGDVILALNGQDVETYQDVASAVGRLSPDSPVQLYVARNGSRGLMNATVGTLQQAGLPGATNRRSAADNFDQATATALQPPSSGDLTGPDRVQQLEARIQELQQELQALRSDLTQ